MKMNVNKEKVKEFVKEHKKELIIAGATMVVGGVVFAITKQKPKLDGVARQSGRYPWESIIGEIEIPELSFGQIELLHKNGDLIEFIANDITVGDLGKWGEELIKFENVTPETGVNAVMSLCNELGKDE